MDAQTKQLDPSEVMPIMIGLMLGMLLGALDQTIVSTALPTIGRALGDEANLPWVVTAYLLAAVAVTPLYGKLSDIYGRRAIMLLAIGLFIAGSVACALAPNMLTLALARGLQGAGGGGLISLAQTIIADIVSPRERGRYQVHIASVFATSSLAGPVLGGFLAEHLHWTAIFWINIPLGVLAFVMVNRRLAVLPIPAKRHRLDILGSVLLVAASAALLLGLSWGGVRFPWGSTEILGLFGAAAVLGALFTWRIATAAEPLIPLSVLGNPVVRTATLAAGAAMGVTVGNSIIVPLYFEFVVGLTASQSGIALIPVMMGVVIGSTIAGRLMVHVEHYKTPVQFALVVAFCSMLVLAFKPTGLPLWLMLLLFAITSMGIGALFPTSTVATQNAVARHDLGTATAVSNFFRQIGGALIVAIFGSIIFGSAARHSAELGQSLAGMDPTLLGSAFGHVFLTAAGCIALAFVIFWYMPEKPLRGAEETAALRENPQAGE